MKSKYDPKKVYKFDPYNNKAYTKDEYVIECIGGLPNESMLIEQWKKLPDIKIGHDSELATLRHQKRVSQLLIAAANEILGRAQNHDESKLSKEEKAAFDEYTPKLKNTTYGSDEYKRHLKGLGEALSHHYLHNSHHPEHYENGINDFDLFDLVEMFFDWMAATERHKDGNILDSIKINSKRFKITKQLASIFTNTAIRL